GAWRMSHFKMEDLAMKRFTRISLASAAVLGLCLFATADRAVAKHGGHGGGHGGGHSSHGHSSHHGHHNSNHHGHHSSHQHGHHNSHKYNHHNSSFCKNWGGYGCFPSYGCSWDSCPSYSCVPYCEP